MLKALQETTKLKGVLERRRQMDREYLMSLTDENLLLPYYQEAALVRYTYLPETLHGGWDSPLSQIRGTVCGHWLLTAAAMIAETGDAEIKARADRIVSELARCQERNGGEWCFSIPEKYLLLLKQGVRTWAPQYVCHKTMAGLLEMYRRTGNEQALEIVKKAADWFWRYTADLAPGQMARMMWEETGGMMEYFADLYSVTGDPRHLELMRRYERRDLFDLLEAGEENPLVNMHANSTVPEILGAARAYEVTGEERYRRWTEEYWRWAVDRSGMFATGGQTAGEAWTPEQHHADRLGEGNQEHCLVYHMMRLADVLFRWTGDSRYADYWERNLYNGIFAQGFWVEDGVAQTGVDELHRESTTVAYHLPLHAGAKKVWGSRTGDFWCCHNTLLQANAETYRSLYYQEGNRVWVAQYQDSETGFEMDGVEVRLSLRQDPCTGEIIRIQPVSREIQNRPDYWKITLSVSAQRETEFELALRLPWWLAGEARLLVDGVPRDFRTCEQGFALVSGTWKENRVELILPKEIRTWPLPDRPETVAFLDGPAVLAGLTEEERTLYYRERPEEILVPHNVRRWSEWLPGWKTAGQPVNICFKPLYAIGHERYTVYFPTQKA